MINPKINFQGKLAIATPFYNYQACSEYVTSMVQTARLLEKTGVEFDFYSCHDSYIGRARNSLCHRFLESDCTDLFFIDSDEDWDLFGFFRVLMSPYEVVGASYRMKNSWDGWTASLVAREGHAVGVTKGNTAVIAAESIPCGFMRLKRSVLESFKAHYPELKYMNNGVSHAKFFECSEEMNGEFTGEDVTFCKRWREMGGEVWVEPNVTITHYGTSGFSGNLDKSLRAAA